MEHTKLPELVYRIDEAATRLKIGRSTFYRLVSRGDISLIKIGGGSFVSETELQRFIDKQEKQAVRQGSPLKALLRSVEEQRT
ncbi:helix-turn-helix transcriptional regulator [Lysobacter niastensis]|uniref:Helix-turn-helix domain-containing protein n=1 Tax=Lysobacter niastensis TaxID=380629 RepID=A0ABS0B2Z5_9GAMM|nr:helix-turn-helix domain-containing protein [Lysobacter niastensis]MBF6022856.1 helix-turn-helix domain-containing protein [Lysobacter niastensis]